MNELTCRACGVQDRTRTRILQYARWRLLHNLSGKTAAASSEIAGLRFACKVM